MLNFIRPFKLHTDTCGSGLGAILYQTCNDGTFAIISYAIRSLNKAETHYQAHKLELLTLKWVVVEIFHKYLYVSTFDSYIDNNPLTYALMVAELHTMSHCWVASLVNYNFWLHYRVGETKINPNALLRISWPTCGTDPMGTY